MKKHRVNRILAATLLCLLLCACASPEPPVQTMPIPQTPAQTPSEAPTEAPTEPPETEFIPAVPPTFLTNPIDPNDPDSVPFLQSSLSGTAVETEQGLFCLNDHLLYHAEPGSTNLRPLCEMSGCHHDDSNCEAWFEMNPFVWSRVGFCDGYVWLVEPDSENALDNCLVRVDPATRQREFVLKMPVPDYSLVPKWVVQEFFFHHDKLFSLIHAGDNIAPNERQYHLFAIDLRTKEIAEPFTALLEQQIKDTYVQPYLLTAFEDVLYSQITFYRQEIIDGFPTIVGDGWIVKLDPQSGSWDKLVPVETSTGTWYRDRDSIYTLNINIAFLEFDITNKELKQIEPIQNVYCNAYDREHIYCTDMENEHLYILDRSYQLLSEVELPPNHQFFCAFENTVYIQGEDSSGPMNGIIDYKLDVAEAGEGELTLQPLEWRKAF